MCEYCNGEELSSKPISDQLNFKSEIETIIDDMFLYTYCNCGRKSVLRINYCPICGRKLGDD